MWRISAVFLLVSSVAQAACPVWPLVIAHRGASGYYPEHTEAAYWQAMLQGADFIEADLVPTRDGVLISRHENELSQSTNVAVLPQFAGRKTRKMLDGVMTEGWFSEDFTLAEIRQLKARESKPVVRPNNVLKNDQYGILTLAEMFNLVERFEQQHGRKVGLYLETKHPTYFRIEGKTLDGKRIAADTSRQLLQQLAQWPQHDHYPIMIQSFEISNLWWMRQQGLAQYRINAKLIQLIGDISGRALYPASNFAQPWDLVGAGQDNSRQLSPVLQKADFHYGDLFSPQGLQFLQSYADGIGPWKDQWYGEDLSFRQAVGQLPAHLQVHPYTFRAETEFLPPRVASLQAELTQRFSEGVDAVFTDFTDIAVKTRGATCSKAP